MKRVIMMSAASLAALALVAFLPGQMVEAHAGYEEKEHMEEREVHPEEREVRPEEEEIVEEERAVVPRAELPDQQQVVQNLRQLNEWEIRVGRIAAERAASPQVRQYGQQLVQEHRQLQQRLQQVEQQIGAQPGQHGNPGGEMEERPVRPDEEEAVEEEELPVAPEREMRPGQQQINQAIGTYIEGLEQLEGVEFDAAFLALQAGLHTNAVHMLTTAREAHGDQPIGRLAEELLPRMQQHLQRAVQLAEQPPRVEG